jgi:hypothetical protein
MVSKTVKREKKPLFGGVGHRATADRTRWGKSKSERKWYPQELKHIYNEATNKIKEKAKEHTVGLVSSEKNKFYRGCMFLNHCACKKDGLHDLVNHHVNAGICSQFLNDKPTWKSRISRHERRDNPSELARSCQSSSGKTTLLCCSCHGKFHNVHGKKLLPWEIAVATFKCFIKHRNGKNTYADPNLPYEIDFLINQKIKNYFTEDDLVLNFDFEAAPLKSSKD